MQAARKRSLIAIEELRKSFLETGKPIWRSQASVTERLDALAAAASLADLVLEQTCDYLDYCEGAISVAYSHKEGSVESMQRVINDFDALPITSVSADLRKLGMETTAAAIHDFVAAASVVMRAFDGGVWGPGLSKGLDPNSAASDLGRCATHSSTRYGSKPDTAAKRCGPPAGRRTPPLSGKHKMPKSLP